VSFNNRVPHNVGHVKIDIKLGVRVTPSSLCTLLPKDVADVAVFGQADEFGLELMGGAVDDSALVVVVVDAEKECDFVHVLVSYDAVSEGTHFVRP
jgi:hypothetical protein